MESSSTRLTCDTGEVVVVDQVPYNVVGARLLNRCSLGGRFRLEWRGIVVRVLARVEVEELRVGEHGEVVVHVELCRRRVLLRDRVQLPQVLRHVRSPPAVEGRHLGCRTGLLFLVRVPDVSRWLRQSNALALPSFDLLVGPDVVDDLCARLRLAMPGRK